MPVRPSSTVPAAPPSPADLEVCADGHGDQNARAARRAVLMPPESVFSLAETFKLLGDPTRVRLIDALARGELCVCDLASILELSESAVSHQLRLLRGVRLVKTRRSGRQVFYTLDDQHILSLFQQALGHVQERARAARAQATR